VSLATAVRVLPGLKENNARAVSRILRKSTFPSSNISKLVVPLENVMPQSPQILSADANGLIRGLQTFL